MCLSYEEVNEVQFETYCKTCIDNAVLKERMRMVARSKWELPFSEMEEASLYALTSAMNCQDEEDENDADAVFVVRGSTFYVHDERIGRALSCLLPKDRDIVLLYYFGNMSDRAVAEALKLKRATVERRRRAAQEMIRRLLEE